MMIRKLLVLVFLLSTSAFGQWTEIQSAWNSTAGAAPASTAVTLSIVQPGDVVIASVMYLGTATGFTMSVTDGNGHNFTQTPNSPCTYSTGQKIWMFYLVSGGLPSMAVTATPSIAHGISIHAIEFTPPAGAPTFDTDVCSVPTTGTTPITTPSITPAQSGVLYAAAIPDPSAGVGSFTGVVGGSWTFGSGGIIAADNNDSADEWQVSATGATAVNWVVTGSSNTGWAAMAMSMITTNPPSIVFKGTTKIKGKVIIK